MHRWGTSISARRSLTFPQGRAYRFIAEGGCAQLLKWLKFLMATAVFRLVFRMEHPVRACYESPIAARAAAQRMVATEQSSREAATCVYPGVTPG